MVFPSPIAFSLFGFPIYWYGLSYALGFWGSYRLACLLIKKSPVYTDLNPQSLNKLWGYLIVGGVLGGRLGYVIVYDFMHYISHPLEILMIRKGGMSFHGGIIGTALAALAYYWRYSISFLKIVDLVAVVSCFGIFWGRLANFVNQEHPGRVTEVPWGIIYPSIDPYLRHPSQIYEALGEGILLGLFLYYVWKKKNVSPGITGSAFLIGYGLVRSILECWREPDGWIGNFLTTGQFLSLGMILVGMGCIFIFPSCKREVC